MEIKDQVPVRLTGGILKTIHDVRDATWVRLLSQIANTHSIARVFEGHHVVRVQRNGPCVFPRRKQTLRQVDALHVVGMRTSGEQIQHVLILPAITHQIVQQENPRSQVFGEQALIVFRNTLVEMNSFALHVLETSLGFSVAVHNPLDGRSKAREADRNNCRVNVVLPH